MGGWGGPDNRRSGAPEAEAEPLGVRGGRRETRSTRCATGTLSRPPPDSVKTSMPTLYFEVGFPGNYERALAQEPPQESAHPLDQTHARGR